jgi:hypothetical protein
MIEVKDKFGRVMQKISVSKQQEKEALESKIKAVQDKAELLQPPKKRRKPKKVTPPKRRMSFTECQLKYADQLVLIDPMKDMKQPTLTDLHTIRKM